MKFENKFIACMMSMCFFLMLAILLFATVFRNTDKFSFFENRNLTEKPEITKETVLTGEYFSVFERYLEDHAAARNTLIKLNTSVDLIMGKPVVNNVVVKDNCLLPFNGYESTPDAGFIEARAEQVGKNLAAHRNAVESYGGHFCYVAVPCQYVCLENEYPWYLNNRSSFTKASSSALFGVLDKAGIDYIDMYGEYLGYSDEKKAQFTSTIDNHFSIYGAYETYLKMIEKINSEWGGDVDVLTEDGFSVEKINTRYLGSRNRKLFNLWSNDESLYCIIPKNEIPFRRFNNGIEVVPSLYSIPSNPYAFATYPVYMGGDIAHTLIDTNRPELPSILIYGDSFTNAVECIAWYSFDKMESVDLRYYKEKTLDELIDELRPDYVFCIRDYEQLIEIIANGQ